MRPLSLIRLAAVSGLVLALIGVAGPARAVPPPAPTVTLVTPASPNESLVPVFSGYTYKTTTALRLYDNAACSGRSLAQGTIKVMPGDYRYWTATVVVSPGSTTDVYAAATDPGGTTCSSTRATAGHIVYKNTLIPIDTKITKKPKKVVKTTAKRAKVSFEFRGVTKSRGKTAIRYLCSMDGGKGDSCRSGRVYRLKPGKHTFSVAAVLRGDADPSPATYSFKVKRKKR